MVPVQSMSFPTDDRNPQVFLPDIVCANARDDTSQTLSLRRSATLLPYLDVMVLK